MGDKSIPKRLGVITGVIALLLVGATSIQAAGFGRILGSLKDEKGLPLPGADVSLLAVKSPSKVFSVQTDPRGKFRLEKLPPGEYAVKIAPSGFKPVVRPSVRVSTGHSTPLHLILQLTEFVAMDPDPRNWDLRTVLRAAPDRRLIFRDQDGPVPGLEEERSPYSALFRNSAFRVSTAHGEPYSDRRLARPGFSFAYAPVTFLNSKYTAAGVWNPVDNSAWKLKNSLDYRLTDRQGLRLSVGYGKTGLFAVRNDLAARGARAGDGREDFHLAQSMSLSAESQMRFSKVLTVAYGLGYDQVRGFETRTYLHPEAQVTWTPDADWLVRGLITARREQASATLDLPDGESIALNDPLSVVQAGRQVLWHGNRHYEVGFIRRLPDYSELSVSAFADRTLGRAPILGTAGSTPGAIRTRLFQLEDQQGDSEGLRVAYGRQWLEGLHGSVAYVLATGVEAPRGGRLVPLSRELLMDLHRRGSFHLISAQIETGLSRTGTHVTTIFKWMPRKPVNTLDLFSDTWDVANAGVNLFIRQDLPLPLLQNLLSGWEASVDVRNLLDQNNGVVITSSGETIILKTPRSFRGGILFRF